MSTTTSTAPLPKSWMASLYAKAASLFATADALFTEAGTDVADHPELVAAAKVLDAELPQDVRGSINVVAELATAVETVATQHENLPTATAPVTAPVPAAAVAGA